MDKVVDDGIGVVHLQFGSSPTGNYSISQHEGLIDAGIDSFFLSLQSEVFGNSRIQELGKFAKFLGKPNLKWSLVSIRRKSRRNRGFLFSLNGVDVKVHDFIRKAVFNYVHWVLNGFLSITSLRSLASLGKPFIFLRHDMWSITGGPLHSFGCDKFLNQSQKCLVFEGNSSNDYSFYQYKRKLKFCNEFDNALFIFPSLMDYDLARSLNLVENNGVFRIRNMREIRIFKSMYKVIARHIPNLDSFYCALICRVFNLNSPYEGWTSLIGSLEFQQERMVGGNLSVFIFWELPDDTMKNSMSPAKFMGYVSDDSVEGEIFSATDLFLVPSFAYNFSVTIFESMFCVNSMEGIDLCGTPEVVRYGKWYSWQCIMQLMTLPEKFIFSLIKILCVVSLMNSYLVLCNGSILY